MFNYQRIQKDCFWDLDISNDDIENIVNNGDAKEINMLFEKILLNSTALFHDLEIFDKKQLESLLENYNVYKIEKMREIIGAEVIIDYVD